MLAALGLFIFELASAPFDELNRTMDWRHGSSERFGARAASQYLGPGEDAVTITGAIAPEITGSYAALGTLVEMADTGDSYDFVDGTGIVWGAFVIERLDQRHQTLLINGVPRKIDFAIDLKRVK
jgi:uncharacterized protein